MSDSVNDALAEQQAEWRSGRRTSAEEYLARYPALAGERESALDLIYSEVLLREEFGEAVTAGEYLRRFPEYEEPLRRQFLLHEAMREDDDDTPAPRPYSLKGLAAGPADVPPFSPVGPGYPVVGELGRGASGVVYLARQTSLDRLVAVKCVRPDERNGDEVGVRFRREATIVAGLRHPNVVEIFEVGEHDGRCRIVMEYLEGGSLAKRLAAVPMPPREAAALVETLARAVHVAHGRGILHRDLKPDNVLFAADGTPKLVDFGLAKRLDGPASVIPSDAVVGTANYMPPEQGVGGKVGPTADVYSLGAILHQALTGSPPFIGADVLDTLRRVGRDDPPPVGPGVPRDLDLIRLRCLEKNPARRYESAEALADDLRRFLDGGPIVARPRPVWLKVWRAAGRRPAAVTGAAVLACCLALSLWGVFRSDGWAEARHRWAGAAALGDQKRAGRVVLFGDGVRELPHRWRLSRGWVKYAEQPGEGRTATVGALLPSVVEFLPAAAPPYRLRMEIRHDAVHGATGYVGVYFAHQQYVVDNRPVHLYAEAAFADIGVQATRAPGPGGAPGSRFELNLSSFHDRTEATLWACKSAQKVAPYSPPDAARPPGPWRVVEVVVENDAVTAYLDGERLTMPWGESVEKWLEWSVKVNRPHVYRPGEAPRLDGGLGLSLDGCSVSIRRVVVEALPPGD